MKAIAIKFESSPTLKYCTIASEDKLGFCTLPEQAVNFIKTKSADGKVYQGTEESELLAQEGTTQRFWIKKAEMPEALQAFGFEQKETETIELSVIDMME